METTQTKILHLTRKPRRSSIIETTLYELMEAVIDLEKDHRQSLRKNKILSDCKPESEIFNLDHKDASRLFSSETSV
jgi:hypothetical protein